MIKLDRALFRALFRLKWSRLTGVMRAFTVVGTAGFLWGVVAFVAFVITGLRPEHLILPWASVALAWTIAEGTKYLFDRARPHIYHPDIAPLIKTPSSSSFPSGHSATAAAGTITLSVVYPPLAPLLVVCGLLVCLSRIYLGVHYPLDVLAGALIGTVVSVVLILIAGAVA